MVNVSREQEAAIFAKLAAAYFKNDPHAYTFDGGDDEPSAGKLMAIRWNDFTVLVLQVAEEFPVSLYSTHELGVGELPHHLGNPCTYPLPACPVLDLEVPADILTPRYPYKAVCADLMEILGVVREPNTMAPSLGYLVEEVRSRLQRTPTVAEWNTVNADLKQTMDALDHANRLRQGGIEIIGRLEKILADTKAEVERLNENLEHAETRIESATADATACRNRLSAIDAARAELPPVPDLAPGNPNWPDQCAGLLVYISRIRESSAALLVENARLKGSRAEKDRFPIHRNARERAHLNL